VSDVYSPALRDLVRRMLLQNPLERPSMEEVCSVADHMQDQTSGIRLAAQAAAAAAATSVPEPAHSPARGPGLAQPTPAPEPKVASPRVSAVQASIAVSGPNTADLRQQEAKQSDAADHATFAAPAVGLLPSAREDASGDEGDGVAGAPPMLIVGAVNVDTAFGRALQAFRDAEASVACAQDKADYCAPAVTAAMSPPAKDPGVSATTRSGLPLSPSGTLNNRPAMPRGVPIAPATSELQHQRAQRKLRQAQLPPLCEMYRATSTFRRAACAHSAWIQWPLCLMARLQGLPMVQGTELLAKHNAMWL